MLRRHPENILISTLESTTVASTTGGAIIEGYGTILAADILECYIKCVDDCVPKVVTVTIVIPTSCECPYEYSLTVVCKSSGSFDVQDTFNVTRVYNYADPAGGTPTADATGAAIAANINADANACVTASYNSSNDTLTLTAKDCKHDFNVYAPTGTITITTPFTAQILTAESFIKLFPIQPGHFGANPSLARCGDYCIYHFKLRSTNDTQDISAANHYNGYEREVNFIVDSTLSDYDSNWKTEMLAAFTCLNDFS